MTFNPSAPKDGDLVSIQVNVQNQGEQGATDVIVSAFEKEALIGSKPIPSIAGHSQGSVSFSYDTKGKSGPHEIKVIVDPENRIAEQSEDNNRASRTFGVQDADLWLTEPYISPNGDGIKDSTQFFFRLSSPQSVKISVVNERGQTVRGYTGPEFENTNGSHVTWDGLNGDGRVVPDGKYQFKILDTNGNSLGAASAVVDNNRSSLTEAIGTKYLLNTNLTCMLPDYGQWDWFPDESGILLNLYEPNPGTPEYPTGLYAVAADGEDIRRIIPWEWSEKVDPTYDYIIRDHALSPDGEKVAIVLWKDDRYQWGGGLRQLWVVDRDGRNLKLLDSYEEVYQPYFRAVEGVYWAPDSTNLLYTVSVNFDARFVSDELWVIKSDGTEKRKIDSDGTILSYYLGWSPDGKRVAYPYEADDASGNCVASIRLSDLSGVKEDVLFLDRCFSVQAIEWLNDLRFLVREEGGTLWLVDGNGGGGHRKISESSPEFRISPDKSSFAFIERDADRWTVKIIDAAGSSFALYDSGPAFPWYPNLMDLRWMQDGTKLVFVDHGYEKVDDCHFNGYAVIIDLRTRERKAFKLSEAEDSCEGPQSYHVLMYEKDRWVELGVLHFNSDYQTKELDVTKYLRNRNGPHRIRISHRGRDAAHIDYVAISFDGRHYKPIKATDLSRGRDILRTVTSEDNDVVDVQNSTAEFEWENIPGRGKISLLMHANEEDHGTRPSSLLYPKQEDTQGLEGDGKVDSTNRGTLRYWWGSLRLLPDDVSLIGQDTEGIFVINTEGGEKAYLPGQGYLNGLSPLGRVINYYDYVALSSLCSGRGSSDLWAISSLLNLSASLQVRKNKSAIVLKGIAADLNFEGYALDYADVKIPDAWNPIAPPSEMSVVNDIFTTWVPPYEGVFYVRLMVWDKAGNVAWDEKRVTWGLSASITNLYKSLDLFSPNGDGEKDTVDFHYRVLEPVHLEFFIYDEKEDLRRTYARDYPAPTNDFITWDGRDDDGRVVSDGKYKLKVFDYELFVTVDNTPPEVKISFSSIEQEHEYETHVIYTELSAYANDEHLKDWVIEEGEGDNPAEWQELQYVPKRFFEEEIEWLVGRKLRITAKDFGGNRSTAVAGFHEEKILLYKWDGERIGLAKDEKKGRVYFRIH